jgi:hypothetical protein
MAAPIVGENGIGMRLAWRSFHAETGRRLRRSAPRSPPTLCQKPPSRSSVLEEITGYDELLNFAGSVENSKCPGMPKQTFHRRTSNEAKAAKNLHCLINDIEGSLG